MEEFRVKVTTSARRELIEERPDGRFLVSVMAPRKEGKANERVRALFAERFFVPITQVTITRGKDQSSKTVRVYHESLPRPPRTSRST